MKKRSHKNTSRLTAKERSEDFGHLGVDIVSLIQKALEAHARETLAREKRRRVAHLSQTTRDAIKNARAHAGERGRDYLDRALIELAKGMRL